MTFNIIAICLHLRPSCVTSHGHSTSIELLSVGLLMVLSISIVCAIGPTLPLESFTRAKFSMSVFEGVSKASLVGKVRQVELLAPFTGHVGRVRFSFENELFTWTLFGSRLCEGAILPPELTRASSIIFWSLLCCSWCSCSRRLLCCYCLLRSYGLWNCFSLRR